MDAKQKVEELLSQYNYCFWIPSTLGRLYFSQTVKKDDLPGWLDRYIVNFSCLDEEKSAGEEKIRTRYVFATTADCTTGTKLDREAFALDERILFYGKTSKEEKSSFFEGVVVYIKKDSPDDNSVEDAFLDSSTGGESSGFFDTLRTMTENSKDFIKKSQEGMPVGDLQDEQQELKKLYNKLVEGIENSISQSCNKKNVYKTPLVFAFEVRIERTGFVFVKYHEGFRNNNQAFLKGMIETYKDCHISPRIYKMVAFFIKSLFHRHYFHEASSDGFIGVASTHITHPAESNETRSFKDIVDYQLGFLCKAVIRINRGETRSNTDPVGLIGYGKSMVCAASWFTKTDKDFYSRKIQQLENLASTTEILESKKNKKLDALFLREWWFVGFLKRAGLISVPTIVFKPFGELAELVVFLIFLILIEEVVVSRTSKLGGFSSIKNSALYFRLCTFFKSRCFTNSAGETPRWYKLFRWLKIQKARFINSSWPSYLAGIFLLVCAGLIYLFVVIAIAYLEEGTEPLNEGNSVVQEAPVSEKDAELPSKVNSQVQEVPVKQ